MCTPYLVYMCLGINLGLLYARQTFYQLRHILQLSSAYLLHSRLKPCLMSMRLPLNHYCPVPVPHHLCPPACTGLYFSTLTLISSLNLSLPGWSWAKPGLKFPHRPLSHSHRYPGYSARTYVETVPICSAHSICPEHSHIQSSFSPCKLCVCS